MNQKLTTSPSSPDVYISFSSPAYRASRKPLAWYIIMAVILLVFVSWGILTESYIVSATFLILGGVYFLLQRHEAPFLEVEIGDLGIRFGKDFYPYSEINSFWIYYDPPALAALNFLVKRKVMSQITIDFPLGLPVAKLRNFLLSQLPEQAEREESMSESFIRHMGL